MSLFSSMVLDFSVGVIFSPPSKKLICLSVIDLDKRLIIFRVIILEYQVQ